MKQSQIILRFLFPTRQDAAEAVHPAMRAFHNPTASLEASFMLDRLGFFPPGSNVSGITKLSDQTSYLARIVSLIQRHTLRLFFCRFRTLYRDTFYRCLNHLAVMPIRSIDCQADRHTPCVGQQTPFNAFLSPIRRVWAGFSPRPMGLWSWHHPSTARTSQSLSTRHSLSEPVPTVSEKHRLGSTPEIARGLCCSNRCRSRSAHSIDNRSAKQKGCHPLLCDRALAVCRRRNDAYSGASVSTAQFSPMICLKSCICSLFYVYSSLNPFKGIVAFEYIGHSGVIRIGSKSTPFCCFFLTSCK